MYFYTTRFLGLPIPPGFEIKMYLDQLEGNLDKSSGAISLQFKSRFIFSMFSMISAPPLIVQTCLQTGKARGKRHFVEGMPLKKNGRASLVGIAKIEPCGNKLLDYFLGLPDEALAILEWEFNY